MSDMDFGFQKLFPQNWVGIGFFGVDQKLISIFDSEVRFSRTNPFYMINLIYCKRSYF